MSGSIGPKPFDPDDIKKFLNDENKAGHLVLRTEESDKTKKVFVYTDKLSWKEKIQRFFGSGAASPKKLIKEMVKQGIYREDLACEVNNRMQGTISKYLPKLSGGVVQEQALEPLVQNVVGKPKNELQKKLIETFQSNTLKNRELALNLLKMGVKLEAGEKIFITENPTSSPESPVQLAIQYKWDDVAMLLLKREPSLIKDDEATKLLLRFCRRSAMDAGLLIALLKAGANVDEKLDNASAFYWLLQNSEKGLVRLESFVRELVMTKPELVNEVQDPSGRKVPPFCYHQDSSVALLLLNSFAAKRNVDPLLLAATTPDCHKLVANYCDQMKSNVSAATLKNYLESAKSQKATDLSIRELEKALENRQKYEMHFKNT